jgi:hypothetical protein
MRIYTVTKADRALAVVRAANRAEAIALATAMVTDVKPREALDVREPDDAEMVGWLERRADYVVPESAAVA